MVYFDSEKNVLDYMKMVDGYDGAELINDLRNYVKDGSTVLEIGMGPGVDLDILKKYYKVAGSDSSKIFVDIYKRQHPNADVFLLNAADIRIDRKFDCVYSNKVLIHLTKEDCLKSLKMQKTILKPGGILFHSFWHGDKAEEHHGLLFTYYKEDELRRMTKDDYNILKIQKYMEFEKNDSIYIILQRK
jgi:SAM-dependent methyltransferase